MHQMILFKWYEMIKIKDFELLFEKGYQKWD